VIVGQSDDDGVTIFAAMKILSFYKESYSGLPIAIWHLSLVMFINRAGAMVLPFLSLYVTKILGFTFIQSGVILAFYGIGSLIGTFTGGQLTDRIGHYPVQLFSLILSGLSFFVLMQLTGYASLCAGLLVTSALTDAFRPANMSSVAELSTSALRTRSIGLIRLAINLGYSAGPAVGGFIAMFLGYKWLFFIDGVTCLMAAILFVFLIPRKKVHADQKEEVHADQSDFASPYQDRVYLFFVLLAMMTGMVFMQYFHTVPVFLETEYHLDEKYIGILMAGNGLLIALIEVPLIHFIDRKYNPFRLLMVGILLIGLAYLSFNGGKVVFFAWLSVSFLTIGEILNFPFATTLVLNRSPQKGRGRYMALYNMSWSFCNIFAPILGFTIADRYGFSILWSAAFGLTLCIALGYLYIQPRFKVQKKQMYA
jgi:predicted MFS family arabinose efflux permease